MPRWSVVVTRIFGATKEVYHGWLMLFNREERPSGNAEAHHPGDGTFAVPVSGGQDLAACGPSRYQLRRALRRAGDPPPVDGSTASNRQGRAGLRPGAGNGADGIDRWCIEFYAPPT